MKAFIKNWWAYLCIDAFCIIPAILYWFFPGIAYIAGGVVITLFGAFLLFSTVLKVVSYDSYKEAIVDQLKDYIEEG